MAPTMRIKGTVILVVLLLVIAAFPGVDMRRTRRTKCPTKRLAREKITGGTDAEVGRYPYAVSLQRITFRSEPDPRDHFCGGILVEKDLVLTAAHCVHPDAPGAVTFPYMNIGGRDLVSDPDIERRTACRTIIHSGFNPQNSADGFDIALIELESDSEKVPVALDFGRDGKPAGEVRALGWGKDQSKPFFVQLQEVEFEVVDNSNCSAQGFPDIIYSMMCAQGRQSDVCKGDSGGPLIKAGNGCGENDVLVGITSFGFSCTNPVRGQGKSPGVYTRIFEYCHWITGRGKHASNVFLNPDCERNFLPAAPEAPLSDVAVQGRRLQMSVPTPTKLVEN